MDEMKLKAVILTIFTPAYNRASTLFRTYESLKAQKCQDFIWLIIDDGSTDNTAEQVRKWQADNKDFEIRYIYKENGGMHTAHNTAYANIDTELNLCIDSDDMLAPGAVEKILSCWNKVKNNNIAGMIGLDADFNGNILGGRFRDDLQETTLAGYYASGGSGDKKLIYRTEVVNQYPPYPVFEGEKYVGLVYKYRLIDQDYKLAVLNEVLCLVEYQPDGSSGTMWKQYLKNPKGFAFLRRIFMQYPISKKRLLIDCIHYVANSIAAKDIYFLKSSPRQFLTFLAIPFGILWYGIMKYKGTK